MAEEEGRERGWGGGEVSRCLCHEKVDSDLCSHLERRLCYHVTVAHSRENMMRLIGRERVIGSGDE